uniref:Secreted protein n=1 Tax=Haemonchus contortus TaxID=6289 RepID=A0A7I4XX71_HAECO
QVTRSAMARYFSFPLLLMALLMLSTVIPSASSKKTSVDKKKPSVKKVKLLRPNGASAKARSSRAKRFIFWPFPRHCGDTAPWLPKRPRPQNG